MNSTFILIDAARLDDNIYKAKQLNAQHDSLYRGRSEEALNSVAPYLFSYEKNSEFALWVRENGWGNSWGIYVISNSGMEALHKHLRKFLIVKTEDNEEMYFRFYDPRVLRIFLPTCDKMQLTEFFGPIQYFIMEDEDPNYALLFSFENGQLEKQQLLKEEVFT
jgi:hypothetical protein